MRVEQKTPIPIWLLSNLTEDQMIEEPKQKKEAYKFLKRATNSLIDDIIDKPVISDWYKYPPK